MTTVLLTGFEPFGGESLNPALEAIKCLAGKNIAGYPIITRALPVVRTRCIDVITQAIASINPDLVLAVGQAGGHSHIAVERIAINVDDFRIPDNAGNQPVDEPIAVDGPAAYWSTLPIKAMVDSMRSQGIPAVISNTAGTFVCNHLFYGLLHALALEGNCRRGGFIHIPYLPEQAAKLTGQPSMALNTIVYGLEVALTAALTIRQDVKITGGTIC